jgi:2,4-dienoyl-CoA reductase-like NADH-dependent reductase (Old Yellow Enzyme family)
MDLRRRFDVKHGEAAGELTAPLTLPCGVILKNRLAKSAMTENLSNGDNLATTAHENLYGAWARSGAGLLLSGNVQVDRRYLEEAGNVAIDGAQSEAALAALRRWTAAGTQNETQFWMQIGHAGRQTFTHINPEPVGPSPVKAPDRGNRKTGTPRALSATEIEDVIARIVYAARIARQTGFTGVQLHGAHGYLISSFLSPRANKRRDEWGGPLENRARLLLEALRAVRAEVGPRFPVALKLNVSDFQEDGFSHADCLQVVEWLNEETIDLLELSGGNSESPAMAGISVHDVSTGSSTRAQDGYFIDYGARVAKVATMPVMVTGGFRRRATMSEALRSGSADIIGLARPFGFGPQMINALLHNKLDALRAIELEAPAPLFSQFWCMAQIIRLSRGEAVDLGMAPEEAQKLSMDFMAGVRARLRHPPGVIPA